MTTTGWSPSEDWGIWAEGYASQANWVATSQAEYQLTIGAFPYCVPEQPQEIQIEVNGATLATHQWTECAHWSDNISIPAAMVHTGQNQIVSHFSHTAQPVDASGDGDVRSLSVGFTDLRIRKK